MARSRRIPPAFRKLFVALCLTLLIYRPTNGFSFVLMGRKKGNLKRLLSDDDSKRSPIPSASVNQGRGQEITGVSLPELGKIKGWEFGEGVRMACANVEGKFYGIQGDCPRCGFDLFKGNLIANDEAFEDLPRIACPTCATTFALRSGKHGPAIKRTGLQGFVTGLAKQATVDNDFKDAKAYRITVDELGKVYCRM